MTGTPVPRVPLWLMAAWWCLKWFAATVVLVVFKLWWLAGPVAVLAGLWGFDPKGGMELGGGLGLFDQSACDDFEVMADLLEQAVDMARQRAARLQGHTRCGGHRSANGLQAKPATVWDERVDPGGSTRHRPAADHVGSRGYTSGAEGT